MDYLGKVRAFVLFQRSQTISLAELLRFLAEETLAPFAIDSIALGVVRANGALHYPAGFGFNSQTFVNSPERVLDTNTPGKAAFLHGEIAECGSFDSYPFFYPENVRKLFPDGFLSSFAIPVPTYGALMVFSKDEIALSSESKKFLLTLGEIFSLHLDSLCYRAQFDRVDAPAEPRALLPLTPRQWAIHEAILRGLPNGAIAKELSYSESLIRQETMRIYHKMGIRGRKDLPIQRIIKDGEMVSPTARDPKSSANTSGTNFSPNR